MYTLLNHVSFVDGNNGRKKLTQVKEKEVKRSMQKYAHNIQA